MYVPLPHVADETVEVIKVIASECNSKRIVVQIVDPTVPHVKLAESSSEARSSCSRPSGTTGAVVTAVAKSVGEDRPLVIAKVQCHAECRCASAACRDGNP